MSFKNSVITGSGSYIPSEIINNQAFLGNTFFDCEGKLLSKPVSELIQKFEEITCIKERRYVTNDLVTSDIATIAAQRAIDDSGIDKESLDLILVAHNFGDISFENRRSEFVPSLAARVKSNLGIKNTSAIAYDILFGCAGWLEAVIQAHLNISTGSAKKVLVVGAETLSRISDPHDRDSMLFSDGAGAIVMESQVSKEKAGIITVKAESHTEGLAFVLKMGASNNPSYKETNLYLKMQGRQLYEFALKAVPNLIKKCIVDSGVEIEKFNKILIHQANYKMIEAIVSRLYKEFGIQSIPHNIMPETLSWLGNSSVATLPTMFDLILKNKMSGHKLQKGDTVVFTSVGAGVNLNAVVYKIPS